MAFSSSVAAFCYMHDQIVPSSDHQSHDTAYVIVSFEFKTSGHRVNTLTSAYTEQSEREAHTRLREAIEMLPEAIVIMDREDRLVLWNKRYAELYDDIADILAPGVSFEHILRVSLSRGEHPEEVGDHEAWLADRLAQHANPKGPHEQHFRNGRWVRHEERRTADGGSIGVRIDITDLKRREESFRLLFESNPIPMWLCEINGRRLLGVNDAAVAHYGFSREQFLTMTERDIHDGDDLKVMSKEAGGASTGNQGERVWRHLKADGTIIQVLTFVRELPHDEGLARLVAIVDVTERLATEARIAHMAQHDALTGLPNRDHLRGRMEEAMARVRRGESMAVLCLDLDHFKAVNDTLGHPVGDTLLKAVTDRLRKCVREVDTVARFGGDEFIVLQPGIEHPEQAGILAQRLIETVSEPYSLDGHQVVIGMSVGIAVALTDSDDPDTLIKNADMALYRAKTDGRGAYRYFESEMDARLQRRRVLELDLRKAFVAKEFELFYQPLVNLASNHVIGFEALLRWNHPQRGMISPAEFIPLAEEIGVIVPLGEWVIRQACMEAACWPGDLKIAVNLSPAQFRSRALVLNVISALGASGLPANRLELEITESVLLQDNEATLATLHQLKDLGVRIAMDDFGTGYSSLSYIRSFPFDKIKIDRSFVSDLSASDCLAIVRAVAGLGLSLGMVTTAEGVETEEQLQQVREQGCTEMQGYLFSPPRPAGELGPFLVRAATGKAA